MKDLPILEAFTLGAAIGAGLFIGELSCKTAFYSILNKPWHWVGGFFLASAGYFILKGVGAI
jgi:4-hydroxybenzoate polyprenyltransferase